MPDFLMATLMDARSFTILIADDDPIVRDTYRLVLQANGYAVLTAGDGQEALSLAEQNTVDVVLLDVLMPNKEGLETLIELRRRAPRQVVYVMSGGARRRKELLALATKFGANGVIDKPIAPQSLIALIGTHFAEGPARMAPESRLPPE